MTKVRGRERGVLCNSLINISPADGGDIAFITYEKGEPEAKIRFKKEDFAKPIAEKWVGMETVDIKELKVVGSLMEVNYKIASFREMSSKSL